MRVESVGSSHEGGVMRVESEFRVFCRRDSSKIRVTEIVTRDRLESESWTRIIEHCFKTRDYCL